MTAKYDDFFNICKYFGIVFFKCLWTTKVYGTYCSIEKMGFKIILNGLYWNFYHLCFYEKHQKQAFAFINPQSAPVSVFIYKWNFSIS